MEMTVKLRLLLTSALFLFAQVPKMQAQVTVDVVKITCEQLLMQALPWTSREIVLWISGYYHGKHDNTIIEPDAIKRDENKQAQHILLRTRRKRLSWMPSRTWD
jgi:hypothetical protein